MKVDNIYSNQSLYNEACKFYTKKSFGQNFLIDVEKLKNIANVLDTDECDLIVEIGCGIGFLTRFLSNDKIPTIAIDIDRRCVNYVNRLRLPLTTAIEANALDFDFNKLSQKRIFVFGNIPYQITTPLIAHLFGEIGKPSKFTVDLKKVIFTIQLEVARRLMAKVSDSEYSALTILANYYAKISLLQDLDARYFYPSPKVKSATVILEPLVEKSVNLSNPDFLRKVIHLGFKQRRKMLKNTLSPLVNNTGQIDAIFKELNIDLSARAQDLSLFQFNQLANRLKLN